MLDRKTEQDEFFFTAQLDEKGPHFFQRKPKKYKALDKSNHIRVWLEDMAYHIMANDDDKYDDIYQIAKKACATHCNEAEIASYEIKDTTSPALFPLPEHLTVRQITEELLKNPIEVTMENEDNPFNGCRLKLQLFYDYSWTLQAKNDLAASAMLVGTAIVASPYLVIENVVYGQQLLGFKIELDRSPRPESKCSIS